MTVEEALRELFGADAHVFDLTADGYAAAMADLRRRDRRRAQAVLRVLEPWLLEKSIFPRRRLAWHETSQGLRARIGLLPDNPHLEMDIRVVRAALGIPDDQLRAASDSDLRKHLEEFLALGGHAPTEEMPPVLRTIAVRTDGTLETAAQAADRNLADQWRWCHRSTASGQPVDVAQGCPDLPPAAVRSAQASAVIDLAAASGPGWLRRQPRDFEALLRSDIPIERAVALLIERHRLPAVSWVAGGLQLYVVTGDRAWMSHGNFPVTLAELGARHGINPASDGSFGVAVAGLDEFVTRDDWDAIWESFVRPRQELLLQRRGQQPQGRQGYDPNRLRRGMPLYREFVFRGGPVEAAMNRVALRKYALAEMNLSTARKLVKDLDALLRPVDA